MIKSSWNKLLSMFKVLAPAFCFFSLISLIIFVFYWRILYVREPRLVNFEFSWIRLLLGLYIIIICVILLYKQILKKNTSVKYLSKILTFYSDVLGFIQFTERHQTPDSKICYYINSGHQMPWNLPQLSIRPLSGVTMSTFWVGTWSYHMLF